MYIVANKKHYLILLRDYRRIRPWCEMLAIFELCIVDYQFAARKWSWLDMKKVDKSNKPAAQIIMAAIAVTPEKTSVISTGNLQFNIDDRKLWVAETREDLWKKVADPIYKHVAHFVNVEQDIRLPKGGVHLIFATVTNNPRLCKIARLVVDELQQVVPFFCH
jgi:chaperone required for assembly of F1-ATPase